MRAAGNRRIKVKVYSGAHHGWESLGPVFDIRDAENWSCCTNFIEDDGRHFVVAAGRAMAEPEYQAWARPIVSPAARAPAAAPPSSRPVRRPTCWPFFRHTDSAWQNSHSRRDSRRRHRLGVSCDGVAAKFRP